MAARAGNVLRGLLGRLAGARTARRALPASPPLGGYQEHRHDIPFVDPLTDEELAELNGLLPWRSFTVDRHGRRFGAAAWQGKRDRPQEVPDRRIVLMNERFALADKHVLEFGCFEGIHTVGLARFAARVTAVDGRVENVTKTIVRAAFYGCHPTVFKYDVEQAPVQADFLRADVLHHVGVLYHLYDPVRHLLAIGRYIRLGVMLDTHYATEGEARLAYEVDGRQFRYKSYRELGRADVFSGLNEQSKWLTLEAIIGLLRDAGFPRVEVAELREERNGPRALLFAGRASAAPQS